MHFHFSMTKTIKRHKQRHENLLHLGVTQSLQGKKYVSAEERKKEREKEGKKEKKER